MHVLEADDNELPRLTARVRVAAAPAGELRQDTAGRELKRALDAVPVSSAVVRRYKGGTSPLVRDAKRGWRSGKFEAVMGGDFDLVGAV